MKFIARVGEREITLEGRDGTGLAIDGKTVSLHFSDEGGIMHISTGGKWYDLLCRRSGAGGYEVWIGHNIFTVTLEDEYSRRETLKPGAERGNEAITITAPMPGLVTQIEVEEGASVLRGEGLCILEAMKMENEIRSPAAGRVSRIAVKTRTTVEKGETIMILVPRKE